MAAKRKTVAMPCDLIEALFEIPSAEDALAFLRAYIAYRAEGADPMPATPPSLRALMLVEVKAEEQRQDISRKRSEAGRKGGLLNFAQAKVGNPLSPPYSPPKKVFSSSPTPPLSYSKNTPPIIPPTLPALSCAREEETDGFSEFWARYPKKFAEAKAREAWARVVVDDEARQKVMDGLAAWITSEQWTEAGGRYIPKAFVFLEDARFLDRPAGRKEEGKRRAQSFDIDDFFAAALAKSYGESG